MLTQQTGASTSDLPDELQCHLGHRLSGPQGEYYQLNPQPDTLVRPPKGVSHHQLHCATCGLYLNIQYTSRARTKRAVMIMLTLIGLLDVYFLSGWVVRLFSSNPLVRANALIPTIIELVVLGTIFALLALYCRRLIKRGAKPFVAPTPGNGLRRKHVLARLAGNGATIVSPGPKSNLPAYLPGSFVPQPAYYPPQQPTNSRRKWAIWALLLVVVITLTGYQFVLRGSGGGKASSASANVPTPQSEWVIAHIFTGNGDKQTDTFTVPSMWRIAWGCDPNSYSEPYQYEIYVMDPDRNLVDFMPTTICEAGNISGTYVSFTAGTFYLNITMNADADWAIQVQTPLNG